jgi:AcrR family transcriptional regulator
MKVTVSRTHARGRERRRQLLDAATALFARSGSRGTGIAAVAERAGVTGATLLHHFGSKEGLLQAVLEDRDERQRERWESVVAPGGLETLRRLNRVAASWRADPAVARLHDVLMAESLEENTPLHDYFVRRQSGLRASLRRAIEEGQRTGEVRADVDARLVAIEIAAFLDGISVQWQLDAKRIPLERVFEQYCDTLIAALAANG